jgi:hypothetical protein
MILGCNFDSICIQILDRLVRSSMAEFQLEGLGSAGQRQQLMAEADAKNGRLAQYSANCVDRVG